MSEIGTDNIKPVKMSELTPIIKELLSNNIKVKLTVTGNSMYPFLRHGTDSVLLSSKATEKIKKGTVVLYTRDNGQYVLHRVIKIKKTHFFIAGDAQKNIEGPLSHDKVIAAVTSVFRDSKEIMCKSLIWRFLSMLWIFVLPFRVCIIKYYRLLRKITG